MKQFLIATALVSTMFACTSADQLKVKTAREQVECTADVLAPYAQYFLSEQFADALEGKDYVGILIAAGVSPKEIEATVAAIKACHKHAE